MVEVFTPWKSASTDFSPEEPALNINQHITDYKRSIEISENRQEYSRYLGPFK